VSITARPDILEFFDRYQRGADTSDPDLVRDCFAETFLNLDPRRAGPVPREALLEALPGRAELFTSIGVEALALTELAERPMDGLHTMVATTWTARFADDTADAEPLVLPSHFLLRRKGTSWQIVAYLNSTDLAAVVAERRSAGRSDEGARSNRLGTPAGDQPPQR
jgi:hypothetical protein